MDEIKPMESPPLPQSVIDALEFMLWCQEQMLKICGVSPEMLEENYGRKDTERANRPGKVSVRSS
jgi:hypothetical protein